MMFETIFETVPGIVFLALLWLVLLLNIVSLPANWIIVGLTVLWRFLSPVPGNMGLGFFSMLIGAAVLGEVMEFMAQAWGAKKYGAGTGAMWAGLIGAFLGAFLGLPFLLGLGALIGALAGAWLGSYLLEKARGRSELEAARAAKGSLVGRFLGIVIKCALGAIMIGLVHHALRSAPSSTLITL